DSVFHRFMQHDRKRERILQTKVDGWVHDRRVEAHLDIRARSGVRVAFDDGKARKKRGAVQGAGDLARAATDAVDQLALGDHGRDLVAVGLVARSDHVVEVELFSRQKYGAVQLRRGESKVVAARLDALGAIVVGFEIAD